MEINRFDTPLPALSRVREAPQTPANNTLGIGNQNSAEKLPQAQIIEQSAQQQPQRQADEQQSQVSGSDFIRVSSSVGKGNQSNGLTENQAIELYRQIEKML